MRAALSWESIGTAMASHAPIHPDRHLVWVRGPHMCANGVLLAEGRLLTSRQALFTYPDAENTYSEAVGTDGSSVVSAACLPSQCLLMNQTVEFSIVSIPSGFCKSAGLQPVQLAHGESGGALQPVCKDDEVAIVTNTGRGAASGCTVVGRLVVDNVTETELCLHALDAWAQAQVGSPVFRHGKIVAIVVALPLAGSGKEGLRALRMEAIVDRLSKRLQLEDAFDSAPEVRYNSDGQPSVRVPASASATVAGTDICIVTPLGPLDQVRKALLLRSSLFVF